MTRENADDVGSMLWQANYDATEGCWADTQPDSPEMPSYAFEELPGRADPLLVLSAVDCYLYQTSGEPDEFEQTLTFGFTYWLHAAAAMRLPGYDEAPWPSPDATSSRGAGRRQRASPGLIQPLPA